MAQTDGERELVLGNKQLISLFFVVVALCGVFFAMGYMVRGNSIKGASAESMETGAQAAAPAVSDKRSQPEPPAETVAATPQDTTPPVETKPAADTTAASPTPVESAKPSPSPGNVAVSTPEAGASYLQVTALGRADADSVIRTLREQSFPAILATSSKDGLFRVLVGPYRQTADIAEAKSRLKTLGFANAFVQKQ